VRRHATSPRLMVIARALVATLALAAAPAFAQPTHVQISPFLGYRWGGHIEGNDNALFDRDVDVDDSEVYGVRLELELSPHFAIELLGSHQPTRFVNGDDELFGDDQAIADVDIDTLQVGAVFQGGPGQVKPYGVVSLGMTRLDPKIRGTSSDERFSGSFGGGVKVFVNRSFGFRVEGRGYLTDTADNFDDDFDHHCSDSCGPNDLFQAEVTAGIILAF
jgi:outer membrane protein with beta-barrel domain